MNDINHELLLIDDEYFDKLIETINQAQEYIIIEMYIFNNDDVGRLVASALTEAAGRGVDIKIIVDGIGTPNWNNAMTRQMELANIQSKIYHPIPWHVGQWHKSTNSQTSILNQISYLVANINKRNHRKICIIDDIVFVGSCNISASHFNQNKKGGNWHDISIMKSNVNINELIYSFERMWGNISIKARFKRAIRKPIIDPNFRLNDTFRQRHLYYKNMVSAISKAKHRIWIMNAYFVPEQKILRLLVKAAKRKVDVRMILPSKSDVYIVSVVSKTFYQILIKSGVRIYEYENRFLHAKVLMIDDIAFIGSSNFNHRSLSHDLEVDAKVTCKTTINLINEIFIQDFVCSKLITATDIFKQPMLIRILGRLLLFIKHWL